MRWPPPGFEPPTEAVGPGFRVLPLTVKHAQLDHQAVLASTVKLRGLFRDGWPDSAQDFAQNLADIIEHEEDFAAGRGYSYTILGATGRCLGCVYVYPSEIDRYDAMVTYWFVDPGAGEPSEKDLDRWTRAWVAENFALVNPAYPGRTTSWQEFSRAPQPSRNCYKRD